MIFRRLYLEVEDIDKESIRVRITVNETYNEKSKHQHGAERKFDRDDFKCEFDRCIQHLAHDMKEYLKSMGLVE